jgi:hypothetical protein
MDVRQHTDLVSTVRTYTATTDSLEAAVSAHIYALRTRKPQVREPRTPKISELEPRQVQRKPVMRLQVHCSRQSSALPNLTSWS